VTTKADQAQKSKEALVEQYQKDPRVKPQWNALVVAALLCQKEDYRQTMLGMSMSDKKSLEESLSDEDDMKRMVAVRDLFEIAKHAFCERCEKFSIPVLLSLSADRSSDEICSLYK